jgi:hypothetical protein
MSAYKLVINGIGTPIDFFLEELGHRNIWILGKGEKPWKSLLRQKVIPNIRPEENSSSIPNFASNNPSEMVNQLKHILPPKVTLFFCCMRNLSIRVVGALDHVDLDVSSAVKFVQVFDK